VRRVARQACKTSVQQASQVGQETTAGTLLGSWLYRHFCFLAPTILRPKRGELSLSAELGLVWYRGGGGSSGRALNNRRILHQRGVEGGVQTCCFYPSKMQVVVLCYIPLTSNCFSSNWRIFSPIREYLVFKTKQYICSVEYYFLAYSASCVA
jgi:hypothetical protein